MVDSKEVLTQDTSNKWWSVFVKDRVFRLSDSQLKVLRDAETSGFRGIIWYEDFAIPIPFISAIDRDREYEMELRRRATEPMFSQVTPENTNTSRDCIDYGEFLRRKAERRSSNE